MDRQTLRNQKLRLLAVRESELLRASRNRPSLSQQVLLDIDLLARLEDEEPILAKVLLNQTKLMEAKLEAQQWRFATLLYELQGSFFEALDVSASGNLSAPCQASGKARPL